MDSGFGPKADLERRICCDAQRTFDLVLSSGLAEGAGATGLLDRSQTINRMDPQGHEHSFPRPGKNACAGSLARACIKSVLWPHLLFSHTDRVPFLAVAPFEAIAPKKLNSAALEGRSQRANVLLAHASSGF